MNRPQITQLQSTNVSRNMNKLNLFVTIRISLHLLLKENPRLRVIAQKAIKDYYKLHQNYKEVLSLATLIEIRIREAVGEKYWKKAKAIQYRKYSVLLKSTSRKKNKSTFTINTGSNNINITMPLNSNMG